MITVKDISTRELAQAFKSRHAHYDRDDENDLDDVFMFRRIVTGGVVETVTATHSEVRAELNTREHIPNKKHSKKLRQLQAQTGLSKEEIYAKHGAEFFKMNRHPVPKKQYEWIVKVYGTEYATRRYVIK